MGFKKKFKKAARKAFKPVAAAVNPAGRVLTEAVKKIDPKTGKKFEEVEKASLVAGAVVGGAVLAAGAISGSTAASVAAKSGGAKLATPSAAAKLAGKKSVLKPLLKSGGKAAAKNAAKAPAKSGGLLDLVSRVSGTKTDDLTKGLIPDKILGIPVPQALKDKAAASAAKSAGRLKDQRDQLTGRVASTLAPGADQPKTPQSSQAGAASTAGDGRPGPLAELFSAFLAFLRRLLGGP